MKALYNLPEKVSYCKTCVLSNQLPTSFPEYKHTLERKGANYLNINTDGICDACSQAKLKEKILIGKIVKKES